MKNFLVIIISVLSFNINAQSFISRSDSIKNALIYQKQNYPVSQYRDVYKFFMQDFYGPGHIITNKESASKNLKNEIEATEYYDGPDYEPTGFQGNFYRVNLRLIEEGKIPYNTYLDAFVESVQQIVPPEKEEWIKIWNEIDQEMKKMNWVFENEEEERKALFNQLSEGNYIVHHSEKYNDNVNFHYRIISREKFNEIILPLIRE